MDSRTINLNIHHSLPQKIWDKLAQLYVEMPHYNGIVNGIVQWYGEGEAIIEVSVEPSGLQFYAVLPEKEWQEWITLFKEKASCIVGYEVGEPEDGYDFHLLNKEVI